MLMPTRVRKPITNFNNAFVSRDKSVPLDIDRVYEMAAGEWDSGTKRGHKVTTII